MLLAQGFRTRQCAPPVAKQRVRSTPGTRRTIVVDRVDTLRRANLFPVQRVSVDHLVCSTKGRLFTSRGRSNNSDLYMGGCIFVDHASGQVHVEFQVHLNTHKTLRAKEQYELLCRDVGVVPQDYQADNGKAVTSQAFSNHLATFQRTIRFAGVGAHHNNGIAERSVQTIVLIARAMMLHAAIHWPQVADPQLWPMAAKQAVYLWNHMPAESSGISPHDLFMRSRWSQSKFQDVHVWGRVETEVWRVRLPVLRGATTITANRNAQPSP